MINTKRLSVQDVLAISVRQESHFFDKKAKDVSGRKLQKLAVAFANADGGDIVIGIKDDHDEPNPERRWAGASNQEYFNFVFQSLIEITPSLSYTACFLQHPSDNVGSMRLYQAIGSICSNKRSTTNYGIIFCKRRAVL